MNSKHRTGILALLVLLVVLAAGCSRSTPEQGEIFGFVTLDGQPVAQAAVVLAPRSDRNAEEISGSVTDGVFEFAGPKGPAPGSYEVILKPEDPDAEQILAELQARKRKSQSLEARNSFLKAVQKKGPVVVEVTTDLSHEIEISLTSR